jgi:hypothetical protein
MAAGSAKGKGKRRRPRKRWPKSASAVKTLRIWDRLSLHCMAHERRAATFIPIWNEVALSLWDAERQRRCRLLWIGVLLLAWWKLGSTTLRNTFNVELAIRIVWLIVQLWEAMSRPA